MLIKGLGKQCSTEIRAAQRRGLITVPLHLNGTKVIVLFHIRFCSLSRISRQPWAHSTSICETVQSAAVLMSHPHCTCVTFWLVCSWDMGGFLTMVRNNSVYVIQPSPETMSPIYEWRLVNDLPLRWHQRCLYCPLLMHWVWKTDSYLTLHMSKRL